MIRFVCTTHIWIIMQCCSHTTMLGSFPGWWEWFGNEAVVLLNSIQVHVSYVSHSLNYPRSQVYPVPILGSCVSLSTENQIEIKKWGRPGNGADTCGLKLTIY